MHPPLSRRHVLALSGTVGSGVLGGCLTFQSETASSLSGTVYNSFPSPKTATVTLTTREETVAFEEAYTLDAESSVRFELDDIEQWYSLSTTLDTGLSNSIEWEVSRCRSWVEIGLSEDRGIDFGFSEC